MKINCIGVNDYRLSLQCFSSDKYFSRSSTHVVCRTLWCL